VLGLLSQILVRGGDHADVDLEGTVRPDGTHFPVLEDAQELHLQHRAHLADLVEEDGSPGGELEHPGALRDRAGEGPALMAEHLGFEQLGGDRAAVDRDERTIGPRAGRMDGAGDELLARAALARDQDRGVGDRHLQHELPDLLDERVLADQRRLRFRESAWCTHKYLGVACEQRYSPPVPLSNRLAPNGPNLLCAAP